MRANLEKSYLAMDSTTMALPLRGLCCRCCTRCCTTCSLGVEECECGKSAIFAVGSRGENLLVIIFGESFC